MNTEASSVAVHDQLPGPSRRGPDHWPSRGDLRVRLCAHSPSASPLPVKLFRRHEALRGLLGLELLRLHVEGLDRDPVAVLAPSRRPSDLAEHRGTRREPQTDRSHAVRLSVSQLLINFSSCSSRLLFERTRTCPRPPAGACAAPRSASRRAAHPWVGRPGARRLETEDRHLGFGPRHRTEHRQEQHASDNLENEQRRQWQYASIHSPLRPRYAKRLGAAAYQSKATLRHRPKATARRHRQVPVRPRGPRPLTPPTALLSGVAMKPL